MAFDGQVEYFEAGSPATTKHYMMYQQGETYGLDHTVKRFSSPEIASLLRPETDIPGLFLTGERSGALRNFSFGLLHLLHINGFGTVYNENLTKK